MPQINRKETRQKVHRRIRKKIRGTAERPRLAVSISNRHVNAQLINDDSGETICSVSSKDKSASVSQANVATAEKVGQLIAEKAKAAKVDTIVYDRGGRVYHGRVKALAEAVREAGIQV